MYYSFTLFKVTIYHTLRMAVEYIQEKETGMILLLLTAALDTASYNDML